MEHLLASDDAEADLSTTELNLRELYPHEIESGLHLRLAEEFGGFGFIAVDERHDPGELSRHGVMKDPPYNSLKRGFVLGDLTSRTPHATTYSVLRISDRLDWAPARGLAARAYHLKDIPAKLRAYRLKSRFRLLAREIALGKVRDQNVVIYRTDSSRQDTMLDLFADSDSDTPGPLPGQTRRKQKTEHRREKQRVKQKERRRRQRARKSERTAETLPHQFHSGESTQDLKEDTDTSLLHLSAGAVSTQIRPFHWITDNDERRQSSEKMAEELTAQLFRLKSAIETHLGSTARLQARDHGDLEDVSGSVEEISRASSGPSSVSSQRPVSLPRNTDRDFSTEFLGPDDSTKLVGDKAEAVAPLRRLIQQPRGGKKDANVERNEDVPGPPVNHENEEVSEGEDTDGIEGIDDDESCESFPDEWTISRQIRDKQPGWREYLVTETTELAVAFDLVVGQPGVLVEGIARDALQYSGNRCRKLQASLRTGMAKRNWGGYCLQSLSPLAHVAWWAAVAYIMLQWPFLAFGVTITAAAGVYFTAKGLDGDRT
jgi:hypothetical protein